MMDWICGETEEKANCEFWCGKKVGNLVSVEVGTVGVAEFG